ncbi:hypothetical protein CLAIMM_08496 [Cladophialophora immunda]|nr:hypothetical protein CLAIMM_08496 [Cladophialophora immunda]
MPAHVPGPGVHDSVRAVDELRVHGRLKVQLDLLREETADTDQPTISYSPTSLPHDQHNVQSSLKLLKGKKKMPSAPEIHHLEPNVYAPNSRLPVLIYRDALPLPLTESTATAFLESHGWEKRGVWGHIPVRHFHPNSHECYGIFQGSSTLLLGCGSSDTSGGLNVEVHAGDVIVLPAGTAHCSVESSLDYRYVGVYPKDCPRWRNELGKESINVDALRNEILAVAMPTQDPVTGPQGPLMRLWAGAS